MSNEQINIQIDQISNPSIEISLQAQNQLSLMIEHEFKAQDVGLRLSIDGKGCDGFTYAIGFTKPTNDMGTLRFQCVHMN